ncbi:MAG: hypothetical protein R3E08_12605 [Thiotrichaceae bacterium]
MGTRLVYWSGAAVILLLLYITAICSNLFISLEYGISSPPVAEPQVIVIAADEACDARLEEEKPSQAQYASLIEQLAPQAQINRDHC